MPRNYSNNEVKVFVDNKSDYIYFKLPKRDSEYYFGKRQKTISFGVQDTPENQKLAEETRVHLQGDLIRGSFDPNDQLKYKHPAKQNQLYVSQEQFKSWTLYELWQEFAEYKKSVVNEQTYASSYDEKSTYSNYFRRLSTKAISTPQSQLQIKNELSEMVAGLYLLVKCYDRLSSMIEWAKEMRIFSQEQQNLFSKFKKEQEKFNKRNRKGKQKPPVKFQKIGEKQENRKGFSYNEMQEIIFSFHNRYNRFKNIDYTAYAVEFLFLTGMRMGELFALNWGDVHSDGKFINISKSYSRVRRQGHKLKSSKNGEIRDLPLTPRAQEILKQLKPDNPDPDSPIFLSTKGKRMTNRAIELSWRGEESKKRTYCKSILSPLVETGKIRQYLKPHATRATFITQQIKRRIDPKTIAYWVGDTTETIMKYYADHNEEILPFQEQ